MSVTWCSNAKGLTVRHCSSSSVEPDTVNNTTPNNNGHVTVHTPHSLIPKAYEVGMIWWGRQVGGWRRRWWEGHRGLFRRDTYISHARQRYSTAHATELAAALNWSTRQVAILRACVRISPRPVQPSRPSRLLSLKLRVVRPIVVTIYRRRLRLFRHA